MVQSEESVSLVTNVHFNTNVYFKKRWYPVQANAQNLTTPSSKAN